MAPAVTTIVCNECGRTVEKLLKNVNRRLRRGKTTFFCSGSCCRAYWNKNDRDDVKAKRAKTIGTIKRGNQYRKKGVFTFYVSTANHRSKLRGEPQLMTEDLLRDLWEKQQGRCALTGVPMVLNDFKSYKTPWSASLDRRDSKIGYTPENIQFVCFTMNLGKSNLSDDQMVKFIDMVRASTPASCQP